MIKSLRANNGSYANLGSMAVQPMASSVVARAQNGSQPTHPNAPGVLPTKQVTLDHPILLPSADGNLTRFATPTLSEIGQHLITGHPIIVPIPTKFNTVMPTYHLSLDSGKEYDPRINKGFTTTATKFQPYEQLTGISHERPEVVMVTNFEPLFNRDVSHTAPHFLNALDDAGLDPYMTNAGRFMDTQMQIRNIRSYNTQFFIKTMKARFNNIERVFRSRHDAFLNALDSLNGDASFLLNLVRIIEAQKAQLDLRHDIYTVDPTQVGSLINANFTQQQTSAQPTAPNRIQLARSELINRHPPRYDFVDLLTSLGYKEATVQKIYSSTKVWMQVLLELSFALKFHTLHFLDIDPSYERNDVNPTTILNPKVTRFSLSTKLPSLPPLSELTSLQPALVTTTINTLKPAFGTIYQNVSFKDEEARITALAHLLSSEYRYSEGLTKPAVVQALGTYYGYNVVNGEGNSTVFDSIIGKFGNNITDFPAQATNTLVSIAQQSISNVGVLSFETKYVEGDTGTLSPGGDFFFDNVLRTSGQSFNTQNIDEFASIINTAVNSFNVIIDGMNLLANPSTAYYGADGVSFNAQSGIMATTLDLIKNVKTPLVDANGNTSKMLQADRLAPVFAYARKDPGTKSALFLYVISKMSRAYLTAVPFFDSNVFGDNTPLVDTLIDQINANLEASLPRTRSAVQLLSEVGFDRNQVNSASALNPSGVSNALKAGTPLTTYVIGLMDTILSQFRYYTGAMQGGFTKYNGYLDTAIMMVAFDLIISSIARYGDLNLTGITGGGFNPFSQGTISYVVSQGTTNHRNSINELTERALGEDTRVQQMIFTIVNTLNTLAGSLTGISNYLKSPPSVEKLIEVAGILGNDQTLISMLFSEQQIMMLASTTYSLLAAAHNKDLHLSNGQATLSANPSDNLEVQILDDSDVSPGQREAVFGYFGTGDFAATKGANKRIVTVAIPQGFTQRIKQKVNIQKQNRASFQNRQNDIVQVCVYKVDMVNSDIIYKPQRFLFEMSRFPTRFGTNGWLPLPARPAQSDIVNSIPTLSFSQNADTSTSKSITNGVEYANATVAGNDGIKNARAAMDDASYSFLTSNQKAQILHNHVVSYLLEIYLKHMTGINMAEYNFDMKNAPPPLEADFVKTITEHSVALIAQQVAFKGAAPKFNVDSKLATVGGVMFSTTAIDPPAAPQGSRAPLSISQPQLTNPSGVPGFSSTSSQLRTLTPANNVIQTLDQTVVIGGLEENLGFISPRNVPLIIENFRTVTSFQYTMSTASDPAALNQKVVIPKQFDRVFNVIVDPTSFEVDVAATTATPYGRSALNMMIKDGEIVPLLEVDIEKNKLQSYSPTPITPGSRSIASIGGRFAQAVPHSSFSFKYRDIDITQGDLITDKYFITIETFDEGT